VSGGSGDPGLPLPIGILCGVQRNRLLLLATAVAVAAAIVAVLVVVAGGGSDSSSETTTRAAAPSRPVLAGIPQHGTTLGKADAPVTVVVYEDPQCPYCAQWTLGTFPSVVRGYVRTGRVKLEYRGINILGQDSEKALRAIAATAAQNRLWNMVDAVYRRQGAENSGWVTDEVLREAAVAAGVDADRMLAARDSAAVTRALTHAGIEANANRVQGTPTFVVVRPPAQPKQLQLTSLEPAPFSAALAAALQ
jgi:protein-disulfide isomerase